MWGVEKVSNEEEKILVGIRGGLEERQTKHKKHKATPSGWMIVMCDRCCIKEQTRTGLFHTRNIAGYMNAPLSEALEIFGSNKWRITEKHQRQHSSGG